MHGSSSARAVGERREVGRLELRALVAQPRVEPVGRDDPGQPVARARIGGEPRLHRLARRPVLVALRHLRAVGVEDHRQVGVDGLAIAERALECCVARRVVEVLLAAQHVRDAHQLVVDDHGEVIGGEAVALADHVVVEVLLAELDRAEHAVHHRHGLVGHAKAHDVLLARHPRERGRAVEVRGAAIAEVALLGARGGAQRLELVRGLERGIGEVARDQRVDRRRIVVEPLGLAPRPHAARVAAERAERGPLVPGDAEPGEILEDPARGLVGGARLVGVLDPQQEAAAASARAPSCRAPCARRRCGGGRSGTGRSG